jgi:C_GCAxxG_C_C family probable redox protein
MNKIIKATMDNACTHFREGNNCAESVLLAMNEYLEEKELIPKFATGFGAGIGRCGSICGAITGGILIINSKYGRNSCIEDKEKVYATVSNFYNSFEKEFGSVICKELTGCDLSTLQGSKIYEELNIFEEKCVKYVEGAMKILLEVFKDKSYNKCDFRTNNKY